MILTIPYELVFSFITLTFLEIVLGIDNIIFIALVVASLPANYSKEARYIGIGLALIIRVLMLLTLSWVMSLTHPLFTLLGLEVSAKSLFLILGGMFLIFKSGLEIWSDISGTKEEVDKQNIAPSSDKASFWKAVTQIALVDFVFSFDSIITAVGMTSNVRIIIAAVLVSMLFMLFASDLVSRGLHKYPSLKIVALAFIFMIGAILVADGINLHIPKGYLYFSLFFAMAVEILNIMARSKKERFE